MGMKAAELKEPTRRRSGWNPSFIKILFDDTFSTHLRIPPAASRKHFRSQGCLGKWVSLLSRGGNSWRVKVRRVGDDDLLFLGTGWKSFAHENSLEVSDILVFYSCAAEPTKFLVEIYERSACLKETATASLSDKGKAKEEAQHRAKCRGGGGSGGGETVVSDRKGKQGGPIHIKTERDSGSVAGSSFNSDYPFFKVLMSTAYLSRGCLGIPVQFSDLYIPEEGGSVILEKSGRLWTVKLVQCQNGRAGKRSYWKMSAGWTKFAKENNLKLGDFCIFELIDESCLLFKVSII